MKWRQQYDGKADKECGDACITYCPEESLTQQHFAENADLNVIVRRFGLDKGPLPAMALDPSYYGDVSDVPDLWTVLEIAHEAKIRFLDLPPKLRARFNNEPARLWEFVNDPENAAEAVRLGLLKEPEPVPESNVPVAST